MNFDCLLTDECIGGSTDYVFTDIDGSIDYVFTDKCIDVTMLTDDCITISGN